MSRPLCLQRYSSRSITRASTMRWTRRPSTAPTNSPGPSAAPHSGAGRRRPGAQRSDGDRRIYRDERRPQPPLMPSGALDRAKARWMEEFADGRLGDLIIWRLFYQKTIVPYGLEARARPRPDRTGDDARFAGSARLIEARAPGLRASCSTMSAPQTSPMAVFRNARSPASRSMASAGRAARRGSRGRPGGARVWRGQ